MFAVPDAAVAVTKPVTTAVPAVTRPLASTVTDLYVPAVTPELGGLGRPHQGASMPYLQVLNSSRSLSAQDRFELLTEFDKLGVEGLLSSGEREVFGFKRCNALLFFEEHFGP